MPGLDTLVDELAALSDLGRLRSLRALEGAQDRTVVVDGRPVINFSSNNYLGLAAHPALSAAAAAATSSQGWGAGASRLIAGNLPAHRELERALAAFHGHPAALLFNSGYGANVGALQALCGPGDAIYSDELNHASIIDGCRLSRASVHVFNHRDVAALEHLLATTAATARRRIIVSDAVFSMDGDVAPLAALADLARRFDAALMVDEAHATGLRGPHGRGLAAELGVSTDIHVGTLGKAFGSFGAYVAGSEALIQVLYNRARSFVFTTALPPAVAAASHAALELIASTTGAQLRQGLARNIHYFAEGLRRLDLLPDGGGGSPVFPVIVGDDRAAMTASARLLDDGVYAQGIRPPTVRPGTARLRFALMATHTEADLEQALRAVSRHRALLVPSQPPPA